MTPCSFVNGYRVFGGGFLALFVLRVGEKQRQFFFPQMLLWSQPTALDAVTISGIN